MTRHTQPSHSLKSTLYLSQTRTHTHTHTRTHAPTHTRTHARTHTRTHAHMHTRTHALRLTVSSVNEYLWGIYLCVRKTKTSFSRPFEKLNENFVVNICEMKENERRVGTVDSALTPKARTLSAADNSDNSLPRTD